MNEKTFDNWDQRDDYSVDGELMVTITLREYRRLVGFHAKYEPELGNLRSKLWKAEEEAKSLRQKIADLALGGVNHADG